MPISRSIPGSDTANTVFHELRCDLISGRDVSAWAAELRAEGFAELADAIDAQLQRDANGEPAQLRPWPNATSRSRTSITRAA